jgi:hypothetical protein
MEKKDLAQTLKNLIDDGYSVKFAWLPDFKGAHKVEFEKNGFRYSLAFAETTALTGTLEENLVTELDVTRKCFEHTHKDELA